MCVFKPRQPAVGHAFIYLSTDSSTANPQKPSLILNQGQCQPQPRKRMHTSLSNLLQFSRYLRAIILCSRNLLAVVPQHLSHSIAIQNPFVVAIHELHMRLQSTDVYQSPASLISRVGSQKPTIVAAYSTSTPSPAFKTRISYPGGSNLLNSQIISGY